jgi:hypothetical protein
VHIRGGEIKKESNIGMATLIGKSKYFFSKFSAEFKV